MLATEVFEMASKSTRYTSEFKRQMVALAHSGRTAGSLSKEYGPTPWTIALWVRQDKRDAGKGDGGLTTQSVKSCRGYDARTAS
jgi:transposase-like protein